MTNIPYRLCVFFVLLFAVRPAHSAAQAEVTIYRDAWGVPHIYGTSPEAAMYGYGFAQAQDRLDDILTLYTIAQGHAARAFGKKWIQRDLETRIARHAEIARSGYPDLSAETRQLIEHYTRGLLDYIREHPEEKPEWAPLPKPYHVLALYRAFIWDWPWGQALGDLKRTGSHLRDDRGSNQWVVGPRRSAEGGPIALIDPHLSWNPENRFYEAHVHGGDLHFFGFSIVGTPLIVLGHTNIFSVAATTGGPDCADVYEEKINPQNPLQYEYDGKWRAIQVREIKIEVNTPEGIKTERRNIERTHHGPIVKHKANRAYVIKTAYDTESGFVEQLLHMIKSANLGDFLNALSKNQMLPQNIMYADIYGNTYYIRAGRVPIRPKGFHWDRPVPGWKSQTEWQGMHPVQDLVQILNPGPGYMQNCNISPGTMMPQSPLIPDHFPEYIYNDRANRSNERGRRALQLLGTRSNMTLQEALEIAVDTYVISASMWQTALAEAYKAHSTPFSHLQPAVQHLQDWDGRMDASSVGASIFRFWMRACQNKTSNVPISRIQEGKPLAGGAQFALMKALDDAVEEMMARIGRIDVPWGDIHRAHRGSISWPVSGYSADGIRTFRAVKGSPPNAKGISSVLWGQFCTTVVLLKKEGISSYSVTPYGQSNRPDSPHFADQGQLLYSKGRLKPTWYNKEEMLKRVETRLTLKVPTP